MVPIIRFNGGSIFVHFCPSSTNFQQAISMCFSCQDRPNDPEKKQQYSHHDQQCRLCSKSYIKPHSQPVKNPANQEYDLYYFLIAIQINFITLENMWILFIQLNYEFSILTTWNKKMYRVKKRTEPHNMHRFRSTSVHWTTYSDAGVYLKNDLIDTIPTKRSPHKTVDAYREVSNQSVPSCTTEGPFLSFPLLI